MTTTTTHKSNMLRSTTPTLATSLVIEQMTPKITGANL